MACVGDTTGDDPYVILDANPSATKEEIRRCYQRKLLQVRQNNQKWKWEVLGWAHLKLSMLIRWSYVFGKFL